MILTAAFQFGMGFLAIMLRYGERGYFQPLVEGIKNCFSRVFWLATCGRCGPCAALLSCCRCCRGRSEKSPRSETKADLEETLETDAAQVEAEVHSSSSSGHTTDLPDPEPSAPSPAPARLARRCECWRWPLAVLRRVVLKAIQVPSLLARSFRWYWFNLAGQAGFIVREIFVIQTLDGWYWEVCAANIAMWMVLLLTARQIWQFSKVREKSPKAVDQILDMLLLPINYGFLCALCVRILKLENTGQNRTIVSAMIDSADIWEAWALWSVLRLFVRIVDKGSNRMVERENDFRQQQLDVQRQNQLQHRSEQNSLAAARASSLENGPGPGFSTEDLEVDTRPRRSISWSHSVRSTPSKERSQRVNSDDTPVGDRSDRDNPQEAEEFTRAQTMKSTGTPTDASQFRRHSVQNLVPEPAEENGDESNGSQIAISTEFSPDTGSIGDDHDHAAVGTGYLEVVSAFKRLSLSGVQAWVAILLVTTFGEIIFKGVLAPTMPTLCYRAYGTCDSCNVWYDKHIYASAQLIIYILCSAALLFVIAFERAFKAYLHGIQPYWKFWGVKIVVSVTYFQWLLFKYGFRLGDEEIYLWHSLTCALEMPVLCILHATYAYPYGKEWVDNLLDELPEGQAAAKADPSADPSTAARQEPLGLHACCRKLERCLYTGSLFVLSAAASVLIICWLLPPSMDLQTMPPVYNFTCEEASVPAFLKEHHTGSKWKIHHYNGLVFSGQEWLPLCGHQSFSCPLGYRGQPVVSCSATGKMELSGHCQRVGCGAPRKVENADPIINFETYTSGMTVEYQCDLGYSGRPSATCGPDGQWQFMGDERCSLIGCGSLQTFLQSSRKTGFSTGWQETMTMTGTHDLDRSYVGETVRFTCSPGYWGRPVALCHEGGQWEITDPCMAFETSSKCSCKARWVHCGNQFLQTDCKEYYGCAYGNEAYTWCEVDPGSCPEEARDPLGIRPAWDYCVNDNFDIDWHPKHVADKGVLSELTGLYIAAAFILAAVFTFFLFRYSAIALSVLFELLVQYFLIEVLLLLRRCVIRIPRALRRQCYVCGWRLHRLYGRGSQKLMKTYALLQRQLGRSQSEADDLTSALLEEGRRPESGGNATAGVSSRCIWRPKCSSFLRLCPKFWQKSEQWV